MKDYFIRLFNYDHFANKLIVEALATANNPQQSVHLMAHLLGAQQVWLGRCKGAPVTTPIWPDWGADVFKQTITDNHQAWVSYLNSIDNAGLEKSFTYKNSKGIEFTSRLDDILAHVINHGTHHRAQIGQQLKQPGADLPATDYILYLWQSNK